MLQGPYNDVIKSLFETKSASITGIDTLLTVTMSLSICLKLALLQEMKTHIQTAVDRVSPTQESGSIFMSQSNALQMNSRVSNNSIQGTDKLLLLNTILKSTVLSAFICSRLQESIILLASNRTGRNCFSFY